MRRRWYEAGREETEFPETPGLGKPIIVGTDGGMVPIVEPSREGIDKRKGKALSWREAKLSLALDYGPDRRPAEKVTERIHM